jgi:subtilisin family serine protease
MSEPDSWRDGLLDSIADEVDFIRQAFRDALSSDDAALRRLGADIGIETHDQGVGYLYARHQLLVRDEYLDQVLALLEQPDLPWKPARGEDADAAGERAAGPAAAAGEAGIQRVIAGVVLVHLGESDRSVPDWLELIDRRLGAGAATPNHVLTVAPAVACCPATEPEPVYAGTEPFPSRCPDGGAGARIYVADTGLLAGAAQGHPWLDGVEIGGPEDVDPLGGLTQPIAPYVGHGTFVAGVARCLAPQAEVVVTNAFEIAGSTLESNLVPRLEAALRGGVDIFHLSIAAASRHDLPLIAFEAWLARLRQYKGVVCVVAAGNSGGRRPSWPAAFPGVVAVGALAADWRSRADFSNHGGWVDVYAPGRDLVNAYATGTYQCHVAPYAGQDRTFYGMARWSGTSFSTPIVSGLIAARMSAAGENARQAADALLAQARRQAIPGVGPVLLPRCGPCGDPCDHAEPCGCAPAGRSRPCGC